MRSGAVVPGARVYDLHRLPGLNHAFDLLDGDRWEIGELFLYESRRPLHLHGVLVSLQSSVPFDVPHEGSDVGSRIRAELEMVGVLVHVQSQDRDAASEALLVSGGVVDQTRVSWHVGQQDPTGTAGECICQGDEFVAPAFHGPEIARYRSRHRFWQGAPVTTKAGEVQLVEQRRVEQRRFIAL